MPGAAGASYAPGAKKPQRGDVGIRNLTTEPLAHMLRLEPALLEPAAQRRRELRVDQEAHQAACTTLWSTARAP